MKIELDSVEVMKIIMDTWKEFLEEIENKYNISAYRRYADLKPTFEDFMLWIKIKEDPNA